MAEFRYVYYTNAVDGRRGAKVIEKPRDLSWGHRDLGVREPGGLTLYFFSRV